MGGHDGLILHGLSKPVRNGIQGHLKDHYMIDGRYPSREFDLPMGESDVGFICLNDRKACYEYVRWNATDQTYCATPVGAHAIYENLAFVKESIIVRTEKQFGVQVKSSAPCHSMMHHYTVFTELFWNSFHKKAANGDSLIATMLAVLDACLQIPHSPHAGHPEYIPMTNPGLRFVELFSLLHDMTFVDGKGRNFRAFIDKLFEMKQWPSPSVVLEEHYRWLHPILEKHRRSATSARRRDPAKYEDYIARRVKQVAANVYAMFGETVPAAEIDRQLKDYENALRGSAITFCGIFGLGILDYIVRALRIRLRHPHWLVYMHKHSEKLFNELPMPVEWFGSEQRHKPTPQSMALFDDLQAFPHLWALTLQWEAGSRKDLICGNRYFDIPCPEEPCKAGLCPNWSTDAKAPKHTCNFTGWLHYFGLWKE